MLGVAGSKKLWRILACVFLLGPGAVAAADAQRGRELAETCGGCHAIPGYRNAYPSFRVPMLGGQHAEYIVLALKAYRDKQRPHATMQAQAAGLSEQDMADVAAYFASLGSPRSGPTVTTGDAAAGRAKTAACTACHGDAGIGLTPEWPNIAGQHESYLRLTLEEYKAGTRLNAVMVALLAPLSQRDIRDLAAYYAAQEGLFTAGSQ